jgi:hypothetical protein
MSTRTFLAATCVLTLTCASEVPASEVRVVYVPEGIAIRCEDMAWKRAPEIKLALTPQIITPPNGGGSVSEVSVRAMHDGEWLSIRLEWSDATADRTVGANQFRDAVSVGFPLGEAEPPPSPFMGDPDHPVAIWQWSADLEAEARGQGAFAERYPHTEGVWYFPQDAAVRREVRAWRGTDPVVAFVATGFGTLARRPTENLYGSSSWGKNRWQVVVRRRLAAGDPKDATFKPGERTGLIVAVWDGSQAEVNGRKSVTLNWTPFALDPTTVSDARR